MKHKELPNYQGGSGHHQGDVGTFRGIQCSCMSGKGNQLFKFIGKFRYLGMGNLRQDFLIKKLLCKYGSSRK